MNPQGDLRLLSRIALVAGGFLLLAALVIYLTAPAMLPMGSDGWFESATAYQRQTFLAAVCAMLGIASLVAGVRLTQRMRAMSGALRAEQAAAISHGLVSAASHTTQPSAIERLENLEHLRRRGLISGTEYATKRSEILDDL